MNLSDIFKNTPKFISSRYHSLNLYVWDSLFPVDYRHKILKKIETEESRKEEILRMKSISNEASLLVFIFVVIKFFSEGTKAAIGAVDTLKELGIDGFKLGDKFFLDRNENVMLGDKLADKLLLLIDGDAKKLVIKSDHIYQILERYKIIRDNIYG